MKTVNKIMRIIAMAGCFSSTVVFAGGGDKAGGGGAQIEAEFRLKGYELITEIEDNTQAASYCSADILKSALSSSEVKIVNKLTDPNTGKPITQLLDAWTVPGHIQLLESSWQNLVGIHSQPYISSQSVEVLILHEIYRATGKCDDDHFKISTQVYSLLSGAERSNFSEMFEFKYQANFSICVPGSVVVGATETCFNPSICDQTTDAIKQGVKANCLQAAKQGGTSNLFKNVSYPGQAVSSGTAGYDTAESFGGFPGDIENQIEFVSPQHPFVLIHDIENGTWTYFLK